MTRNRPKEKIITLLLTLAFLIVIAGMNIIDVGFTFIILPAYILIFLSD